MLFSLWWGEHQLEALKSGVTLEEALSLSLLHHDGAEEGHDAV